MIKTNSTAITILVVGTVWLLMNVGTKMLSERAVENLMK